MKNEQNTNSSYKISINPESAFTIKYEDNLSSLLFCIEFGEDPKNVFLNKLPSESGRMVDFDIKANRSRVDLAIDRVKAYFESQGMKVQLE